MKKRKGIKMMMRIVGTIVALLLMFVAYFVLISTGKIKEYKDSKGNRLEGSISEKIKVEINGALNGLFINGKNTDNPILLLISSGPGTDDYFFNEKYPNMHMDDAFTVCYWNYRGMGIVYDDTMDPQSIDLDTLLGDLKGVTEYLKNRFHKDKIYLMGFSGGTHLGLCAAQLYPEDYYAYIGMAQVICRGADNDTYIYNFMKDTFSARNDKKRLEQLETLVKHVEDNQVVCKNWYNFVLLLHEAGGGTTMNETEFVGIDLPIVMSHCYTVKEKFDYIKGMKMYRNTMLNKELENVDYRKGDLNFEIPVYFLSGDHDYNCPWPLVREYSDRIQAPDKKFYLVENAAHSPLWEQADVSYDILKEIKTNTYTEKKQ